MTWPATSTTLLMSFSAKSMAARHCKVCVCVCVCQHGRMSVAVPAPVPPPPPPPPPLPVPEASLQGVCVCVCPHFNAPSRSPRCVLSACILLVHQQREAGGPHHV
jgi:hypothetical protein